MKYILGLLIIINLLFLSGCNSQKEEKIILDSKDLESQMMEAYNNGLKALDEEMFFAKKFQHYENIYPQSIWAPRSILMAAYSYYSQDYYGDAISELKDLLRLSENKVLLMHIFYWQLVIMN